MALRKSNALITFLTNRLASILIVLAIIMLFWVYRLDKLPADYTEYGEVDLASLCIHKAKEQKRSASALYNEVYQRSFHSPPRVAFEMEICQLPLEMLVRTLSKRFFGVEQLLWQFKLTTLFCLMIAAAYLYRVLGRVMNRRSRTICMIFLLSSFPLVSVGRMAGRLGCFLSAFLVGMTLLHMHLFLRRQKTKDLYLAGVFTGLSFFNQLHSNIFILPCCALTLLVHWLFSRRLQAKDASHIEKSFPRRVETFPLSAARFTLTALIANLIPALITFYALDLDRTTHWSEFLLIGSYSFNFVEGRILFQRHDWTILLDQFKYQLEWYLRSFFHGHYYYHMANHVEEFNFDYPLFTPVFSILFLAGLGWCLFLGWRRLKSLTLYAPALSMVIIHLLSVLAYYSPIPPRYMLSTLLGYVLIASGGLRAVEIGMRSFHWGRRVRFSCLLLIILLHLRSSFLMIYTGDYAVTGGNILSKTVVTWSGNALATDGVLQMVGSDRLESLPIVCNELVYPPLISHCLGLRKLDDFEDADGVFGSRLSFSQFCLDHGRKSQQALALFYHFLEPVINRPQQRLSYAQSSHRQPFDPEDPLRRSMSPQFVLNYPDGRGEALCGYFFDLSFMSRNVVQRVANDSPASFLNLSRLQPDFKVMFPKLIPYQEDLIFECDVTFQKNGRDRDMGRMTMQFLSSSGRHLGQLEYFMKTSKGRLKFSNPMVQNNTGRDALNGKHWVLHLSKEWRRFQSRNPKPHHADDVVYVAIHFEGASFPDTSASPVVSHLSLHTNANPSGNLFGNDSWIQVSQRTTPFEVIYLPNYRFLSDDLTNIQQTRLILLNSRVSKRLRGTFMKCKLDQSYLDQKPAFIVIQMKVRSGNDFTLFVSSAGRNSSFSIPVWPDGKSRSYIIQIDKMPGPMTRRSSGADLFDADIERVTVYNKDKKSY